MTIPSRMTPDAVPGNWVSHAPPAVRPYLRLMRADRPIGTWLLLIPCWWGLGLASAQGAGGLHFVGYAALFAIGAFVMRSAGCAYNDIVDRDYDAQVARTAARPIPAGEISVRTAWGVVIALSLTGLLVLIQFNPVAIFVGVSSLVLVAAYPFMKRITYWPQAWLGLTFNWGALVAYAAATGELSFSMLAIYAAGISWTLGYDTIYAYQDTEDDALIGVKSTALRIGDGATPWLVGFFAATILFFALAGAFSGFTLFYYLALAPAAAHFALQIRALDINDTHNCLRIFKSNRNAGLLLLLAPLTETFVRLV